MSFKIQFKALLEELVLPEIQSLKTGISETAEKFDSVESKISKMSEKITKLDEILSRESCRTGSNFDGD